MARLFGTDGIRGVANRDLTAELAMKTGMAGALVLARFVKRPKIIIASDTRKSKDMLLCALAAGICAVGADVLNAGVLPTPSLPYLVRRHGADAAVMISASHNPMRDNGIKWFNNKGFKLSDAIEDEIEQLINVPPSADMFPEGDGVGVLINHMEDFKQEYIDFLCSTSRRGLKGFHIALDCANGAASYIAPDVFKRLGAVVHVSHDNPDGCNINDGCGSTHINKLQQFVLEVDADMGFAFDGDADRMIAVDGSGNIVDGDKIMGVCARAMKREGTLKEDTLVLTVMSNLGLRRYMEKNGIKVAETSVGDRYVLEEMVSGGYNVGGEQSGHIIFLDYNTSGDGILTAIQLADIVVGTGISLKALATKVPVYPQVLLNVEFNREQIIKAFEDRDMWRTVRDVEEKMGDTGRVLIRRSGTEPLIRVMLEGQNLEEIAEYARLIAEPLVMYYGGKVRAK